VFVDAKVARQRMKKIAFFFHRGQLWKERC
jgi:hypothetical protein